MSLGCGFLNVSPLNTVVVLFLHLLAVSVVSVQARLLLKLFVQDLHHLRRQAQRWGGHCECSSKEGLRSAQVAGAECDPNTVHGVVVGGCRSGKTAGGPPWRLLAP